MAAPDALDAVTARFRVVPERGQVCELSLIASESVRPRRAYLYTGASIGPSLRLTYLWPPEGICHNVSTATGESPSSYLTLRSPANMPIRTSTTSSHLPRPRDTRWVGDRARPWGSSHSLRCPRRGLKPHPCAPADACLRSANRRRSLSSRPSTRYSLPGLIGPVFQLTSSQEDESLQRWKASLGLGPGAASSSAGPKKVGRGTAIYRRRS